MDDLHVSCVVPHLLLVVHLRDLYYNFRYLNENTEEI